MYLHEVLSDIRLALVVAIFAAGWAFGLIWSFAFWLIDYHRVRRKNKRK